MPRIEAARCYLFWVAFMVNDYGVVLNMRRGFTRKHACNRVFRSLPESA